MTDKPSTPARPVAVKKATRASKPKVRTACRTCKRRRVKCDEAKPRCQRCSRAKLACEGYGIFIDVGTNKHLIPQTHILTPASSSIKRDGFIFYRGLNALSQLTELENSSYDFARACTVNDMSTLGCPHFWSTTVLQSCHSEPAILHAVLALGAAHRSFTSSRIHPDLKHDSFAPVALSHYGKAIKHLRSGLAQTQPARYQVILIVCVILLSFDLLQQRYPAALTHLRHGRRLLKMTYNSKTPDRNPNLLYLPPRTQSIDEELIYSFSQIDLQATNFGGIRPEFILVDSPEKEEASELSMPDTFASVNDAGRYILIFMNDCWRLSGIKPDHSVLHNGNPEAVSHQRRLLKSLERWEAAFAKSRLRPSTERLVTDPDARKALILEIHHALITINISAILAYPDELIFDSLIDSYSTIVSVADRLLPSLPIFNFDAAVILPLYHTALKCRHPAIRRRAIDLLLSSGREGMWDSRLVATCAKEVVRLEEEHAAYQHDENASLDSKINLSELIPDNARIAETWMFFVDEKQEVLRLVQKRWKHPERLHTPEHSPAAIDRAENWEVIDYHVPVLRT